MLLSGFDETPHGEVIDVARCWFDRPGAASKLDLRRDRVTLSCGSLPIDPALLRKVNGPGKAWILNVPTGALTGHGMFEVATSQTERLELEMTADDCAGRVGVRWLEHLNRQGRPIAGRWKGEDFADFRSIDPTTRLTGLELISIFSRLATAGEEATRAGLTGWAPGTAKRALMKCFADMVQADGRRAGRPPDAPGTLTIRMPAQDELDDGA